MVLLCMGSIPFQMSALGDARLQNSQTAMNKHSMMKTRHETAVYSQQDNRTCKFALVFFRASLAQHTHVCCS